MRARVSSSINRSVNGNEPAFCEISEKVAREVFILSWYVDCVLLKMVVREVSAVLNCERGNRSQPQVFMPSTHSWSRSKNSQPGRRR